jgi:UDP-N-acetylmuramoyl-tripeptide--D-alanyl-D-alanine ligase
MKKNAKGLDKKYRTSKDRESPKPVKAQQFTLKEIAKIVSSEPFSFKEDRQIEGISTDTRKINKGELFIALNGNNFRGADFVYEAAKKGAAGVVIGRKEKVETGLPIIKVDDTTKALGDIARAYRELFDIPVIAVTGSNGKTTTKDMIAHILASHYKILKTEATENNQIGVPLTLLKLKDQQIAVFEIGTNSPGEIAYHCSILRPTVALITNIGPSHLKGLKDIPSVLKEKFALVESLGGNGIWIKNLDDPMLTRLNYRNTKIIDYSIKNEKASFYASNIKFMKDEIGFIVNSRYKFNLRMLGVHNVYNALAAIAVSSLYVDMEDMREALFTFKGPRMRMEVLNLDGFTIINDSYNSNPISFKSAVSVLSRYPAAGRKILVVADMLELGEDAEELHYECGKFLADNNIDILVTYGGLSETIAKAARDSGMDKERIAIFKEKNPLIDFLQHLIKKEDVILIKGSRRMGMEEVADCFTTCSIR